MALINCTECAAQISDKAASCPHCGAPCATPAEAPIGPFAPLAPEKPTVIEQTGKDVKLMSLLSFLGMFAAVPVGAAAGDAVGWTVFFGCLFTWIYSRFLGWWRHG